MTVKCPKCQTENPDTARFCSNCATSLLGSGEISYTKTLETPVLELTRGTLFAERYEIIEELGTGGMGKVYRVEDTKAKEEIALKLIKPEIAADKKTIERFRNELTTARKIRHKNICGMYDLGEDKGSYYITMEYVPGQDLKSLIRQTGRLTSETAISISKQVCDGLSEAHRLGVVHRDLKPSNIMIDKDGHARIMDFGIARSLRGKGLTGAGVMIGTPEYMSPEQVEGKEVDQRADIYSLGVILYEMVTGQVPFEGDTPLSIAHKHKYEAPQEPNKINAQIRGDLNSVIMKCLAKDKEQRYQTAEELRSELESIEKGIPTTEREIPRRKPLTSKEITVQFTLRKALFPLIGAIALVIVVLWIWHPWSKEPIQSSQAGKPTLSIVYFKNNTGEESLDIWRSALPELLISDLSQSRYIDVLSADRLYSILRKLDLIEAKSYASEDLKKVAQESGATHVLQGILTKSGDVFRINWTIQELPDLEVIASDMVEGKGAESFFPMVDELTQRIKPALKLSQEALAGDIDESIGKITTSSPEAFKYYIEGFNLHRPGRINEAMPYFQKAVSIDPEFAMAYRILAVEHSYFGYRKEAKKCLEMALELSDRVSDRERFLIQGSFYRQSERTYDKAIEAYKNLLELYPDDPMANSALILIYLDLEEWEKIEERFEVIRHYTGFNAHYFNLAESYMARGMYDSARKTFEYLIANVGDYSNYHNVLAEIHLCQGAYASALAETNKAVSMGFPSPGFHALNFLIRGDVYHCQGEFAKAEEEYNKIFEIDYKPYQLVAKRRLAALCLTQGKARKSLELLEKGLEMASQSGDEGQVSDFSRDMAYIFLQTGRREEALRASEVALNNAVDIILREIEALYQKGIVWLEMNKISDAESAAYELKNRVKSSLAPKYMRYYYHLLGRIEFKKENLVQALDHFQKALSLLSYQTHSIGSIPDNQALFYEPLALVYQKMGNSQKARDEFERILSLTPGRLHYGDIYAKSYYRLGRINEEQGDTAKAIEHLEKFLDLWKDADPGIAEVDDASKRLAGLLN